jgi:hypothetical protein
MANMVRTNDAVVRSRSARRRCRDGNVVHFRRDSQKAQDVRRGRVFETRRDGGVFFGFFENFFDRGSVSRTTSRDLS